MPFQNPAAPRNSPYGSSRDVFYQGRMVALWALPQETIHYGPWKGSMRSISADLVPPDYIAGGTNFLYTPRYGGWKRRGGQTINFDTLSSGHEATGLLPAKWGAKARQIEEFTGPAVTDGVPTVAALLTKETVTTGLDDGRYANLWWRDRVNNLNRTLCDEYGSDVYPGPGSSQQYRVVPLWYESGDGGLTRGTSELARRFFGPGSRRFLKVGNRTYLPSRYGTPFRWSNARAVTGTTTFTPNSNIDVSQIIVQGGGSAFAAIATTDATKYIQLQDDASRTAYFGVTGVLADNMVYTVTAVMRRTGNAPNVGATFIFALICSNQARYAVTTLSSTLTASFATYTFTVNCNGSAGASGLSQRLEIGEVPNVTTGYFVEIDSVSITAGTAASQANRVIPSGPLPPTHAGFLAKGNLINDPSQNITYMIPDGVDTAGGFLTDGGAGTLNLAIDEEPFSDADFIVSASGTTDACIVTTANPGTAPAATDTVQVKFRAKKTGGAVQGLLVQIRQGTTVKSTYQVSQLTTSFVSYAFVLSAAEQASISDWTDVRIRFAQVASVAGTITVSYASIQIMPASGAASGGWSGHDRFFYSVAYRFEDGSVWQPALPRFPNNTLPGGLQMFTVDSVNPTFGYDFLRWTFPIGPDGTVSRLLLRSLKINVVTDDVLQLNPYDMRLVQEIHDNTSTTYDDFFADDDSLTVDPGRTAADVNGFFIRFDHLMPPRTRYVAGGDMRVCHAHGGYNPCAITLAPVGRAADFDLNATDDAAALYSYAASYMRVVIDPSATNRLELVLSDGTTNTTVSFNFATYTTLQQLVDGINATSVAVNALQWRAQLAPGANPDTPTLTGLTPHSRLVQSCVVSGQTITLSTGGLSKLAVGALISGAGVAPGAYVSVINSDTQLTFIGTISAATKSLTFFFDLGDNPTAGTTLAGFQRVIGNSLPGFLYLTATELAKFPVDKQATWMTTAAPGSNKSAANNFSSKTANVFRPPNAAAGILQGVAAVDHGFVVYYANKRGAIRNTRDFGTGVDEDYRLFIINESSGCAAWNTVGAGNRFAHCLAPEGVTVSDLHVEHVISGAIFVHGLSDAQSRAVGDFAYELPLCVASSAADDDTAYASAKLARGNLWVCYRSSGANPNRMVAYDFSLADEGTGVGALLRGKGAPWGWSVPLVRAMSVIGEGRRGDGSHLYGWNEQNQGAAGDGRIDEFEVTDQDNGVDIVGEVDTPWMHYDGNALIAAQEIQLQHLSPTGSTGGLDFHRSYSDDLYTLTPGTTGTLVVQDELKMLPTLGARAVTKACYIGFRQATGGARELRKMELRLKRCRQYK